MNLILFQDLFKKMHLFLGSILFSILVANAFAVENNTPNKLEDEKPSYQDLYDPNEFSLSPVNDPFNIMSDLNR